MEDSLPDTPAMRLWWSRVFSDLVSDAHSRVPIALDTSTNAVVGAITAHGVLQGQPFGGFMIHHPPIEDHGKAWPELVRGFAASEKSTVGDRARIVIEILGVDEAYQSKGVGARLVAEACKFADEKGWPIFLDTGMARNFYLKRGLGFKLMSSESGEEGEDGQILREPVGRE